MQQHEVQEAVDRAVSEFFSPQGLADYLDVPVRSVYSWRARGEGPKGFRVGRHVRFRRSDVARWLEGQADQPAASRWTAKTKAPA